MNYLLDTNTCIYIINKRPVTVAAKLKEVDITSVCISSITTAELFFGVRKSSRQEQNQSALNTFLLPFEILNFDDKDSYVYGEVRFQLEKSGLLIGSMDLLIASQAISKDLILVTNNLREFQRLKDLKFENWV
ncbi:MAG: type II toxin-antitoxin system VapC family toxin [Bacteroidota bacterium]|nr:type II toxin-antitoxin system VapC family toxin [Bacteroidota bacterium]